MAFTIKNISVTPLYYMCNPLYDSVKIRDGKMQGFLKFHAQLAHVAHVAHDLQCNFFFQKNLCIYLLII